MTYDMVEDGQRVFRYPPIGGVPAHHYVPSEWELDSNYIPNWGRGADLEEPVVVHHVEEPIDPASLTPISGVPAEDGFFRNGSGQLVVGFIPSIWPTTSTHLVAERAGYDYRLHYSAAAVPGEPAWVRHRVLYALTFTARQRGFLTHALGFRHPAGFGVLCPARGGTGKSTLAGLIRAFDPEIPLLSDDRVVVRREHDRFNICGTPWRSAARVALPDCVGLGAMVFMKHGAKPTMRRVPRGEAMRRILQCVALPYWDSAEMDVALGHLDVLVSTVPALECAYGIDVGSAAWLIDLLFREADGR